ncbi:MAG: hypothetical protein WC588_00050 [Candidatus Micrarchaeia archaeon]
MKTAIFYKIGQQKAIVGEDIVSVVKPVIFVVLLLLVSISFAADASNCQYATLENKTRTIQNTYVNGERVAETVVASILPRESTSKQSGIDHWYDHIESFKISNRMNIPIVVHATYNYDGQTKTKDVSLSALQTARISEELYGTIAPPDRVPTKLSSAITVSFTSMGGKVEMRQDPETYQVKDCKLCPSDNGLIICKNDWEATASCVECGSGRCEGTRCCTINEACDAVQKPQTTQVSAPSQPSNPQSTDSGLGNDIRNTVNQIILYVIIAVFLLAIFFAIDKKNSRRDNTIIIERGSEGNTYDDNYNSSNYGNTDRQPPSRYPCNKCNTSGRLQVRCTKCNGKGTYYNHIRLYGREETCPVCKGTGTIYEICRSCGGEGWKI